jgi:hypothetical protein
MRQDARNLVGAPYGVTVNRKKGVLIIHSFIHDTSQIKPTAELVATMTIFTT